VIPHGIDFSKYDVINENRDRHQRIENDKKIISFVGRLSKENYVHHFPEIIEKLLTKRADFLLALAGDGELRTSLEEQIKNSSFPKSHLMLLGFQDQEECLSLRKASDICGGFSLIEACAAARPVVAYAVEWHSELVINNVTGFLIDENDTDRVALVIDQLLSDQAAANRMGKKAAELARKKHDIRLTSEIKTECYNELLQIK